MKAKEILYLIGLKPKPKTYGCVVQRHEVGRFGPDEILTRWDAYDVFCVPEGSGGAGR